MKKREIEKIFRKLDLIKCPLKYENYIAILKRKGIIEIGLC